MMTLLNTIQLLLLHNVGYPWPKTPSTLRRGTVTTVQPQLRKGIRDGFPLQQNKRSRNGIEHRPCVITQGVSVTNALAFAYDLKVTNASPARFLCAHQRCIGNTMDEEQNAYHLPAVRESWEQAPSLQQVLQTVENLHEQGSKVTKCDITAQPHRLWRPIYTTRTTLSTQMSFPRSVRYAT